METAFVFAHSGKSLTRNSLKVEANLSLETWKCLIPSELKLGPLALQSSTPCRSGPAVVDKKHINESNSKKTQKHYIWIRDKCFLVWNILHSLPSMSKALALTTFFIQRLFLSVISDRGVLEKVMPWYQFYYITTSNFPLFSRDKLLSFIFGPQDNRVCSFLHLNSGSIKNYKNKNVEELKEILQNVVVVNKPL